MGPEESESHKEKPNKSCNLRRNDAILTEDLGLCLPNSAKKPDGSTTHPPLPTTREQGPGLHDQELAGVESWIYPERGS